MAIDRSQLIKRIREIEGLSADERSSLLELLRTTPKYGLVWENKPEAVETQLETELPVLTEVKDRAIISNSDDAPNHILIEGDNLHALTALTYTHEGKVDVIYIDPPYNTGKKQGEGGFFYNDVFVDETDEFRHSKWLSFIARRLKIAKRLLSKKGVIFISIGDDEMAQLKVLCDQIFLSQNFIENYVWESTFRPDNSSPILRRNAEFVLCYAANKSAIPYFKGVASETEGMPSLTKGKEKVKTITFPAGSVHTTLPNGVYSKGVKPNGNNLTWELVENATVKDGIFISDVVLRGHSYWSTQKKILNELSEATEIWIKSESFVPYYKKSKKSENRPTKILPQEIVADYLSANTEIGNLFDEKVFNNPKPTTLIGFVINFTDNKNATILDFFAGSGTTLHATMQLNAEDSGRRQCILVTNNENGICENVTYERNRRVIKGYTTPKGVAVDGLTANTLRYYRTDFVPRRATASNIRKLVKAATDLLCIKNNIYTEKLHLDGNKLKPSALRYFADGNEQMLVIYDERSIAPVVEVLVAMPKPEKPIKVYVFSPNRYAFDDEFEDVADRVTLCALPAAIYDAYKRVLPKQKRQLIDPDAEHESTELDTDPEEVPLGGLFDAEREKGGEA